MNRIALVVFFSLAAAAVAIADPLRDTTPNISVTGEAHEEVAPDRATIRFGVVTERPTAVEAATENARAAQAIVAELEAQGVAGKDVETQGVTLAPITVEERDPKGVVKRAQKLFRARNDLAARIKPAEKAGQIASLLIDKGANVFDGIEFDFSNPEEKLDALRAAAVKDALRRAQVYAEAVGLRLGRVLEIRPEPDEEGPQPRAFAARGAGALADAAAIPVRPGVKRLGARVSVTWALSR
jgi:uncharacterized protein YggE